MIYAFKNNKWIYSLLLISISIFTNSCSSNKTLTTSATVSSATEWESIMMSTLNNYKTSITLRLNNYNDKTYDLNKLHFENAAISAHGTNHEGTNSSYAIITYTIKYNSNEMIIQSLSNKDIESHLSAKELQAINKAKNIVTDIIKAGMTPYQKEQAIHDYLVANYKYDNKVIYESGNSVKGPSYLITGMLTNKTGCCEAYAYTFQLLCKLAGLDVRIAFGCLGQPKKSNTDKQINTHAWNIVNLDGEFYHVDVTSDDPVPDIKGEIYYDFFNLNDNELSATHYYDKVKSGNISCNGTKYNYFRFNNKYLKSMSEVGALIKNEISKGSKSISFYAKGFSIKTSEDFEKYLDANKIATYSTIAEFGKEGVYTIKLTYR